MKRGWDEAFDGKARIMKALAHPARLFIVQRLSEGEKCVCELTAMLGLDVSTVSRHLGVLKSAGIVRDEKRGLQVFYSLRCPCVVNFFGCIEGVVKESTRRPRRRAG